LLIISSTESYVTGEVKLCAAMRLMAIIRCGRRLQGGWRPDSVLSFLSQALLAERRPFRDGCAQHKA
jgi:hypothetical protein